MSKLPLIAVIDDDEVFRFLTDRSLRLNGIATDVLTFEHGAKGISYLKEHQSQPEKIPEVIILDIIMPVLDGWGFLEEVKSLLPLLNKDVKIYLVSALVSSGRNKNLLPEYVAGFLQKPLTALDLKNIKSANL